MLGQDYRIKEIFESKRNMSVTAFTRSEERRVGKECRL